MMIGTNSYMDAVAAGFSGAVQRASVKRFDDSARDLEKRIAKLTRGTPEPSELAELRRDFAALIITGAVYQMSPERIAEVTENFVDETFGLTYAVAQGALSLRSGDGRSANLPELLGANAMDGLFGMLSGRSTSVPQIEEPKKVKRKYVRRIKEGESGSNGGTLAPDGTGERVTLESYIPRDRLVPRDEYKGFSADYLVEQFGYKDPRVASAQVGKIRRENDGKVLALIGDTVRNGNYDFRGVAHYFIKTKLGGGASAFYERQQVVGLVQAVLTLEGLKKEHIEPDAAQIILMFDRFADELELKNEEGYIGRV